MNKLYDLCSVDVDKYPIWDEISTNIKETIDYLFKKQYEKVYASTKYNKEIAKSLKMDCINDNNEDVANCTFYSIMIFDLIENIANFWESAENVEYAESWDKLQNALDCCKKLTTDIKQNYLLNFSLILEHLLFIEKLYPYNLFASISLGVNKLKCSICGESPFNSKCDHISGELYWGNLCFYEAQEIGDFDHIAITPFPRDKRCIILIKYDKMKVEESPFRMIYDFINKCQYPLRN